MADIHQNPSSGTVKVLTIISLTLGSIVSLVVLFGMVSGFLQFRNDQAAVQQDLKSMHTDMDLLKAIAVSNQDRIRDLEYLHDINTPKAKTLPHKPEDSSTNR
jgi:hypothetical protein